MRWIASMFRKAIIQAIIFSIVFLIIVYAISRLGLKVEAIHVFIALVPFIILLIISGKLKTLKGPGGLEYRDRMEICVEQGVEGMIFRYLLSKIIKK